MGPNTLGHEIYPLEVNSERGTFFHRHSISMQQFDFDYITDLTVYLASLLAGLLLFGIGIIGAFDLPAQPSEPITVLLMPLFGEVLDRIYWAALAFLGFWLTLSYHARPAAGAATVLVVGKLIAIRILELG